MAMQDTQDQNNQPRNTQKEAPTGYARTERKREEIPHGENRESVQTQESTAVGIHQALTQRHRRPAGRSGSRDNRSVQALNAFKDVFEKLSKNQDLNADHVMIRRFDRQEHGVPLSSILIYQAVKVSGRNNVVVRPFVLESKDVRPTRQVTDYSRNGAQRTTVNVMTADIFDDKYWDAIVSELRRELGDPSLEVSTAGPMNIPAEFNFEDEERVADLLDDSVNRIFDVIEEISNSEPPFVPGRDKADDERLTARLKFGDEPREDLLGNPVRTDILVSMHTQPKSSRQRDDEIQSEHDGEINSVGLMVVTEYTGTEQSGRGWSRREPDAPFRAACVITSVQSGYSMFTPEMYTLALSNANKITANDSWIQAFEPSMGVDGLRNVGALGLKHPDIGAVVDTSSGNFSDRDFRDLLDRCIKEMPIFQIDVNPMGENSVFELMLLNAAGESGAAVQREAEDYLIAVANNLTSNIFSEYFTGDSPIVVPSYEVPLGYWEHDGERRDIRDLDVIAMLNETADNPEEFDDWYALVCGFDQVDPDVRINALVDYARQYLNKNLVITGRAHRLTFTPAYIEALEKATVASGVNVEAENIHRSMGMRSRFMGNTRVDEYAVTQRGSLSYGGSDRRGARGGLSRRSGTRGGFSHRMGRR